MLGHMIRASSLMEEHLNIMFLASVSRPMHTRNIQALKAAWYARDDVYFMIISFHRNHPPTTINPRTGRMQWKQKMCISTHARYSTYIDGDTMQLMKLTGLRAWMIL